MGILNKSLEQDVHTLRVNNERMLSDIYTFNSDYENLTNEEFNEFVDVFVKNLSFKNLIVSRWSTWETDVVYTTLMTLDWELQKYMIDDLTNWLIRRNDKILIIYSILKRKKDKAIILDVAWMSYSMYQKSVRYGLD